MAADGNFSPGQYARTMRWCCSVALLTLALLVGWLQLGSGREITQRAIREQTRLVYLPPCRGRLLDRSGIPLNYTVPGYSIVIRPELIRDPRDTRANTAGKLSAAIANLGLALGKDFYDYRPDNAAIMRHLKNEPAMPMLLWEDVDDAVIARWALLRHDFPATELLLSWRRVYAFPEIAAHLRGRVRKEIPVRDADRRRFWNANAPVLRGISGMEKAMEAQLSGRGGTELLQTDVLSYRSRVIVSEAPDNGDDIRLTIDSGAQRLAQKLFAERGYSGAAVAMEMSSGEILVMHSSPASTVSGGKAAPEGSEVNRALAGFYPPGSTLKPLLALYAQENGIAESSWRLKCPGYYLLGQRRKIGCSHIHGDIAMKDSIALSCNTYYCALAQRFTEQQFNGFADEFGFGRCTGALLQEQESSGIAFTPGWVNAHRSADPHWRRGDAANAGIGQGGWAVTPMQLLLAVNYALTGRLLEPLYYRDAEISVRKQRSWKPEALELVRNGMKDCVLYGTGSTLRDPQLAVMAKTGTAEVGGSRRPHAWVVAAAPTEAPRYIVAVVVENGGSGGRVAGPVAMALLRELFKLEQKENTAH